MLHYHHGRDEYHMMDNPIHGYRALTYQEHDRSMNRFWNWEKIFLFLEADHLLASTYSLSLLCKLFFNFENLKRLFLLFLLFLLF
ncbi:hypothetical protein NIES4073_47300 [Kalymmatonema gypsitolerans NIES-4073]|nr:hypothetical protein NIES4073_47300 [Scytonema sp. NIES-4073]